MNLSVKLQNENNFEAIFNSNPLFYCSKEESKEKENLIRLTTVVSILEKTLLIPDFNFDFQIFYTKCYELCLARWQNKLCSEIIMTVVTISQNLQQSLSQKENSLSLLEDLLLLVNHFDKGSKKICDSLIYVEKKVKMTIQGFSFLNHFKQIFFYEVFSKWTNDSLLNTVLNHLALFREKGQNPIIVTFFKFLSELIEIFLQAKDANPREYESRQDYFLKSLSNLNEEERLIKKEEIKISVKSFKDFNYSLIIELIASTNKYYSNLHIYYKSINTLKNYGNYIVSVEVILRRESELFSNLKFQSTDFLGSIIQNLLVSDINFTLEYLLNEINRHSQTAFKSEDYNIINKVYILFTSREDIKELFLGQFSKIVTKYYTELSNLIKKLYDLDASSKSTTSTQSKNKEEFKQFLRILVEKKKNISRFIELGLNKDIKIEYICKNILERLINANNGFLLKKYVSFIHEEIKLAIKLNDFNSIGELTEHFLIMYRLISEKDLFEKEYREQLSVRLLRNSLFIKDTEFPLIEIMKLESGKNFMKKIETMIQDLWVSKQIYLDYSSKLLINRSNTRLPSRHVSKINQTEVKNIQFPFNSSPTKERKIEFNVKILDSESWPINTSYSFRLTQDLTEAFNDFSLYFTSKNKGKNLTLINQLSWAEVKVNICSRKYVFISSGLQALILCQFNKIDNFPIKCLIDLLQFNLIEQSKDKVLKKEVSVLEFSKEVEGLIKENILLKKDDCLYLNSNFYSNEYKIVTYRTRIRSIVSEELNERESCPMLLEDRKYKVDAYIMRIIKSRKVIDFSSLYLEVKYNLSKYFLLESNLLKLRVEHLIERDLILRDAGNNELLKYTQ